MPFRTAIVTLLIGLLVAALPAEPAFRYSGLKVRTLESSGASSGKVDLVVVGDGYAQADLGSGRVFEQDAQAMLSYLWGISPFTEYRGEFNVHLVYVESHVDRRRGEVEYAFGSTVDPTSDSVRLTRRSQLLEAARNAPAADIVVAITTVSGRATGGTLRDGSKQIPAPVVTRGRYTSLAHELGHSLGGLGDEYESTSKLVDRERKPLSRYGDGDAPYPNVTLDAFIDPSSRQTLQGSAKWAHFLKLPGGDPLVGAYQGGLYHSEGVWRPSYSCAMRSSRSAPFCPICHEALVRKIFQISGRPFDDAAYHRGHPLGSWR